MLGGLIALLLRDHRRSKMANIHSGHAPGHVRDAFLEALEAFLCWNGRGPEPTVTFEVDYEPRKITISQACGLVWHCTDTLPGHLRDHLAADYPDDLKGTSYASAARLVRWKLEQRPDVEKRLRGRKR